MSIGIVKYNAGNIFSVKCALNRLGIEPIISDDEKVLSRCEKVLFPGVGEAAAAMSYLKDKGLDTVIRNLQNPVLGICIGQQLMCRHSEEGDVDCLGIFDVDVKKFVSSELSVPHTGWNTINMLPGSNVLFYPEMDDNYVYYVHSYYVPVCEHTIATTDYINPFSAALHKDNFYATQFHPEKSGGTGELILKKFLSL